MAVSWPALDTIHAQYRLRQAGQLVQVRMSAARVHAIDSGVPHQFRFEPGGQRFLVLPYDQQALAAQPGAGHTLKVTGKLPSTRAQFAATGGQGSGQPLPGGSLTGIANAADFGDAGWSAPILFFPDGTAMAATVVIRDKKSQMVTVSVRGLTGSVSVSKIERGGT